MNDADIHFHEEHGFLVFFVRLVAINAHATVTNLREII